MTKDDWIRKAMRLIREGRTDEALGALRAALETEA